MPKISQSQFIQEYYKWANELEFNKLWELAIPCKCEDEDCKGWAMINVSQIKTHLDLYS